VLLAAGIASAVLVAAGRPMTHVAVVGGAGLALIAILALVSRRASRPVPGEAAPPATPEEPSPTETVANGDSAPWAAFERHHPERRT